MNASLEKTSPPTMKTAIPFYGFYNSGFDVAVENGIESMAEYYHDKYKSLKEMRFEDISDHLLGLIDMEAVMNDFSRRYTELFAEWILGELGMPAETTFRYEKLISPREYNFETDRVFVDVDRAVFDKLMEQTPEDVLNRVIIERHSHRSGFYSLISNDTEVWKLKGLHNWDRNQLETLILAWMEANGHDYHETLFRIEDEINWAGSGKTTSDFLEEHLDFDALGEPVEAESEENAP